MRFHKSVERPGSWRGWWYPVKDSSDSIHVELVWKKLSWAAFRHLSFRFHVGNAGSETPFDGHLHLGVVGMYWTVGFGRKLAARIGRGHKRDLYLAVHGGSLWWRLWYDDDNGYDRWHNCDGWRKPKLWPWSAGRRKHRGWMCLRDGNIDLNPLDAIWGRPRVERTEVASFSTPVTIGEFEGDEYDVTFTLEDWVTRRQHGPAWVRRVIKTGTSVDWRCDLGIPERNHDWKGDNVYASGFTRDFKPETWGREAVALLVEDIKAARRRYGYCPPQGRAL